MFGSLRRFALLAVAALGFAAGVAPALAYQPKVIQMPAGAAKPGGRGLFNDLVLPTTASRYGRKGASVSMAAQQRASRKARNVARNRRNRG